MTPESPVPPSEQVAAFFQKHRTGLVTLVFTDLVDSVALLNRLGDQAGATFMQRRRQVVREVLQSLPEGEEIETAGDSFLLAFAKPSDGVRFALQSQARLRRFSAESNVPVQERIGIHLGEVVIAENETVGKAKDFYGIQLATCFRVMSLAAGGQVLLTRGAFDSARQVLKGEDLPGVGGLQWVSHGPYLLKGIEELVEVCEVGEVGQSPLAAPKTTEKAQRQVRPDEEPVLGWRPAVGQEVPNTPWVLEEKLGEGGFGEVWVAHHPKLKERRVFKFCFRADRVRALKRELTLFRLLREHVGEHPNIVRLYEVYFDQPPYFLEEEFVEGKDLKTWCEAQGGVDKVPLEGRLEIVAQAAEALQAAHDAGIIHRDVKPGNILVSRDPSGSKPLIVKLTDFGIGQVISAEFLRGVTQAGFTQTMLGSTSSGTGTTMYLAPEIIAGMPATTRSDTYSLGVVLYQLLIGDFRRPVTADWSHDIADPLLREDLQHCFAGKPEGRFAGAEQLAKNLRALAQRREERVGRDRLHRQAAQRQKIVVVSAGAAVLLLLLAIALGYGLSKAERARQLQRRYVYASDMKAAQVALQQNNRAMTVRLLRAYLPKSGEEDLRGVEWRYLWQESQGDELLSFSHPTMVDAALFTPDGRNLATRDHDGTVRVWEMASGRQVQEWQPKGTDINASKSLGCSADGKWLAAPGRNGVEIWDTTSGSVIRELKSTQAPLCFSPDGKFLATGATNGLWLWDLRNWTHRELTNASANFNNLAFAPDGIRMVCGDGGGRLQFLNLRTGSETVLGETENPAALEISPDGKWLACGNWKGEVSFWDLASQQEVKRFRAHPSLVLGLAFSPDSQRLATGGNDQLIHLWETGTTNKVGTLQGHLNEIWSLAFSRDGQKLVSSSKDGTVKLWSAKGGRTRSRALELSANCIPAGPLPDGSALVTMNRKQRVTQLWSLPGGELLHSFAWTQFDEKGCSNIWHMPGNQLVLGRDTNGTVHSWSLKTGAHLSSAPLGATNLEVLCLSLDNRWMLGTSPEGGLTLFDLHVPRSVRHFADCMGLGDQPRAVFSADGRWFAYCITNYAIKIWDLAANREKATLKGHAWHVNPLRFSPDGKLVASGGMDGDVWLWSVDAEKPLSSRLSGHRSGVWGIFFSTDGKTVLSGAQDETARWWSVATRKEMLLSEDLRMVWYWGNCGPSVQWDLGGKILVWQDPQGLMRVTTLPTLAEIDAAEAQASAGTGR